MIDIEKIKQSIPHRYPFLLVDRILEIAETSIVGLKNVTINEPFFQGHFPDEAVMPGVLILESMGQVASMMILNKEEFCGKVIYLTGIDKAKFRKPVFPGDTLITRAEVLRLRGNVGKVKARAFVNDKLVAEAEYSFVVMDKLPSNRWEESSE